MFTRTFIEKTLLDIGGLTLDEELSNAALWHVFACRCPRLTATLSCKKAGAERYDSVLLTFDDSTFQKSLEARLTQIVRSGHGGIAIHTDAELEGVCNTVRMLISELPVDFEPNEAAEFEPELDKNDTETEALIKERRGQEKYRLRLEQLWDSRCAVTGVAIPEVLRASHAKPWKDCETGKERLDPYNGFLLTANLDALFDKFLISFTDNGAILLHKSLDPSQLNSLGIDETLRLRFVRPEHLPYLSFHRNIFRTLHGG